MTAKNLTRHASLVSAGDRWRMLGHRGAVVWMTGLSGSGKSTLAYALERRLIGEGHIAFVLDGDNVRHGLSSDLGFSPGDRDENIRRVGEVAALFADAGVIAIASFISPYRAGRAQARERAGSGRFVEVYLDVPLEVCEDRDPKGLYQKVRAGEIPSFTGITAPYEEPESPELRLDTAALEVGACVEQILAFMRPRFLHSADDPERQTG